MSIGRFSTGFGTSIGMLFAVVALQLAFVSVSFGQMGGTTKKRSDNQQSSQRVRKDSSSSPQKLQTGQPGQTSNRQPGIDGLNQGSLQKQNSVPAVTQKSKSVNPGNFRTNQNGGTENGMASGTATPSISRSTRSQNNSDVAKRVGSARRSPNAELMESAGIPAEARDLPLNEAIAIAKHKLVRDLYDIPAEATKGLSPTEMLSAVANLQTFGGEGRISDARFWNDVASSGIDAAMGPVVRETLGLPEGVRDGALSSKVLEDAGVLQQMGLDIGDRENWGLLDQFQSGAITGDQLIDIVSGNSRGGNNTGRGTPGDNSNKPGGTNSGSQLPGSGSPASPGSTGDSKPADSSPDSALEPGTSAGTSAGPAPPASGSSGQGEDEITTVDPESFSVVVTHNDDGTFTVDTYHNDGLGTSTKVNSESFADTDGDGAYEGEKGGSTPSKAPEGSHNADYDENEGKTTFAYTDGDSESDTKSGETDTSSSKPTDDNEYTPDPTAGDLAGLYNNAALMQSLYQFLADEKLAIGKGGKDSSPNPMNETMSGKKSPVDYKSITARPVDGSSAAATGNIQEMIQQIQDPNAIQGGVIDPVKN